MTRPGGEKQNMRTPHEGALAQLKAIQDKFQAAPGALPADQMNALFASLVDVVKTIGQPAAPAVRRISYAGMESREVQGERMAAFPADVQAKMDHLVIASTLLKRPVKALKMYDRFMSDGEFAKAMDSTTAGEGDEWVPTILSPNLVEEVTKLGFVEQMHGHIPMPSQPYEVPLQTGRLTPYKTTEATANSGQTGITKSSVASMTNKLTLTAVGLGVEVLASKEAQEDSIVAILPFLRGEIIASLARGIEDACINGDTTGTHMDSDAEAAGADDRRTLWKGYRKHAMENSYSVDFAAGGNSFDFETFMKVRAKHGKYGVNPADLFWLLSLVGFFKSLSLKDANGNAVVTTADKFGAQATSKTGILGSLAGSEIAVSEFSRDDLNASAVYESGATKLSVLSVQKSGFIFGERRGSASIQLLDQLYAEYQQDALLSVIRKAFAPIRPIASNAAVAIGYNISA